MSSRIVQPRRAAASRASAKAPSTPALDASYDWHVLLAAPLGSVLKDTPLALHEVLLFRDEAKRTDGDEGDCYAIDGTAPTFVARVPDEYLLCFKHNRLARVEATVRVPQDRAVQVFADACGLWFRNAALPTPVIAAATESSPAVCAGHDESAQFSGRLEVDPQATDVPLSIKIDAMEQR